MARRLAMLRPHLKLFGASDIPVGRNLLTELRVAIVMFRAVCSIAVLFPLVIATSRLSAQSQSASPSAAASQPTAGTPLRFEVASIRPHKPTGDDPSNRRVLPGGRFVATA